MKVTLLSDSQGDSGFAIDQDTPAGSDNDLSFKQHTVLFLHDSPVEVAIVFKEVRGLLNGGTLKTRVIVLNDTVSSYEPNKYNIDSTVVHYSVIANWRSVDQSWSDNGNAIVNSPGRELAITNHCISITVAPNDTRKEVSSYTEHHVRGTLHFHVSLFI